MAKLVTPTWAPNTSKPPYSICCLRSNDGHSHERVQGAVEFPLPSQSRSEGNGVMDAETSSGTYTPFASSQTAVPGLEWCVALFIHHSSLASLETCLEPFSASCP